MSEKNEEKKAEMKTVKGKEIEVTYSADEFQKLAKDLFHCQPECVKAAFMSAQKTEATEAEAKKIVSDFMKKEV